MYSLSKWKTDTDKRYRRMMRNYFVSVSFKFMSGSMNSRYFRAAIKLLAIRWRRSRQLTCYCDRMTWRRNGFRIGIYVTARLNVRHAKAASSPKKKKSPVVFPSVMAYLAFFLRPEFFVVRSFFESIFDAICCRKKWHVNETRNHRSTLGKRIISEK